MGLDFRSCQKDVIQWLILYISAIFDKGDNFVTSSLLSYTQSPFWKGVYRRDMTERLFKAT